MSPEMKDYKTDYSISFIKCKAAFELTGGAFVFCNKPSARTFQSLKFRNSKETQWIEEVGKLDKTFAIIVEDTLRDMLTEEELKAVIGHEVGHIMNGDLLIGKPDYCIKGEMAADKYGASFSSNEAMVGALKKIYLHNKVPCQDLAKRIKALGAEVPKHPTSSMLKKVLIGVAAIVVGGVLVAKCR